MEQNLPFHYDVFTRMADGICVAFRVWIRIWWFDERDRITSPCACVCRPSESEKNVGSNASTVCDRTNVIAHTPDASRHFDGELIIYISPHHIQLNSSAVHCHCAVRLKRRYNVFSLWLSSARYHTRSHNCICASALCAAHTHTHTRLKSPASNLETLIRITTKYNLFQLIYLFSVIHFQWDKWLLVYVASGWHLNT